MLLKDADNIRRIKRGHPFETNGVVKKQKSLMGVAEKYFVDQAKGSYKDFRIFDNLKNYYWLSRKFLNENDNTNPSIRMVMNGLADNYLMIQRVINKWTDKEYDSERKIVRYNWLRNLYLTELTD